MVAQDVSPGVAPSIGTEYRQGRHESAVSWKIGNARLSSIPQDEKLSGMRPV